MALPSTTHWMHTRVSPVYIGIDPNEVKAIDERISSTWQAFEKEIYQGLNISPTDCQQLFKQLTQQTRRINLGLATIGAEEKWKVLAILDNLHDQILELAKTVILKRKQVWVLSHVKNEGEFQKKLELIAICRTSARKSYHAKPSVVENKKLLEQWLLRTTVGEQGAGDKQIIAKFWDDVRKDSTTFEKMDETLQKYIHRSVEQIRWQAPLAFASTDHRNWEQDTSLKASFERWIVQAREVENQALQTLVKDISQHQLKGQSDKELQIRYIYMQMRMVLPVLRRKILQQAIKLQIESIQTRLSRRLTLADTWSRDDAARIDSLIKDTRQALDQLSKIRREDEVSRTLDRKEEEGLSRLKKQLQASSSRGIDKGSLSHIIHDLEMLRGLLPGVELQQLDETILQSICTHFNKWPWLPAEGLILSPEALPDGMTLQSTNPTELRARFMKNLEKQDQALLDRISEVTKSRYTPFGILQKVTV